jgi:hypothetical protein
MPLEFMTLEQAIRAGISRATYYRWKRGDAVSEETRRKIRGLYTRVPSREEVARVKRIVKGNRE